MTGTKENRQIDQMLPSGEAESERYIRIIDDSGDDYLYPHSYFIPVHLPQKAQEARSLAK